MAGSRVASCSISPPTLRSKPKVSQFYDVRRGRCARRRGTISPAERASGTRQIRHGVTGQPLGAPDFFRPATKYSTRYRNLSASASRSVTYVRTVCKKVVILTHV
ncbi:unnamed protein product [Trichogramma brassicae]|uniref:Uncharacterized protein n=1 Tax=Trichogramma brassicae TaxID=86971 RepID=A0A6H5HV77_9HYME|nr:unnamed protein product [Trichogramma brassicae]